MEKRIGILSIILSDRASAEAVNREISLRADTVLARQGLPLPGRGVSVITLVMEATTDQINALAGTLGKINGVSAKSLVSKQNPQP